MWSVKVCQLNLSLKKHVALITIYLVSKVIENKHDAHSQKVIKYKHDTFEEVLFILLELNQLMFQRHIFQKT